MKHWIAGIAAVLLLTGSTARAQMSGCTGSSSPVATADEAPWVSQPQEVDVLGNDYDPQALPFQIISVTAMGGGTPTVTTDGLKIVFAPAGNATSGAFTYTIRNESGGLATATVNLRNNAPPAAPSGVSISWNCQDLECWFTSQPANGANIRAYRWILKNSSGATEACSRQEWTANGFSCRFATYGTKIVEHAVLYYSGEVAMLNPAATVTVGSTPPAVTWKIVDAGLRRTATLQAVSKNDPTLDSYYVDWGDGTPRNAFASAPDFTNQSTDHTYVTPGPRTVKIIHRRGTVETAFPRTIEVFNLPPAPAFTTASPAGDQTVRFDVPWWDVDEFAPKAGPGGDPTGSSNPNAPPLWEFEFGDGTSLTFKPTVNDLPYKSVEHTYPAQRGVYRARLKIVDHLGATGIHERDVVISGVRPVADVSVTCKGMQCIADASRSADPDGGSLTRYEFEFLGADGSRAVTSSSHPVWVFTVPGAARLVEYQVNVIVTDSGGLTSAPGSMWGVATPETASATQFYATKPCRLLDTRSGSPSVSEVVIPVAVRGKCGVPAEADVVAAAVSVTVLAPNASGRVAVPTPAGGQVTSFLNFLQTAAPRSGNAVLKLDGSGRFSIVPTLFPAAGVTGTTHLTVDLLGFYRTDRTGLPIVNGNVTGPLRFTPSDGCTLLDTRTTPPAVPSTAPERRFDVAGVCGLSETALAAAITTTVISPSSDASVVLYPAGSGVPVATSVSGKAGRNQANGGTVLLNGGAAAAMSSVAGVQVMVGTTGEFTRGTEGLRFHPLAPCRLFDTRREGTPHRRLASGEAQSFRVAGTCGIATNARAAVLYATVAGADGNGNLRLYPAGADVQDFATVNFLAGENVGNTTVVPLGGQPLDLSALLSVFGGGTGADLILEVYGYYAP